MLDEWTNLLESGGQIDAIYMDFAKAFDKVSHTKLLIKLKSYGITQEIINWIQNLLIHRRHCVKVYGKSSDCMSVLSGIPQGTILGPILFLIYINDLPDICEDIYLYADDAKSYKLIRNDSDYQTLQENFNELQKWSNKWQLQLNAAKCKVISFGRGDMAQYKYTIISQNIAILLGRDNIISDLGITIDQELKFTNHINEKIQ